MGRGPGRLRDNSPVGLLRPLWDSEEKLSEVPGACFRGLRAAPAPAPALCGECEREAH